MRAKYRNDLPQMTGSLFLTDGGLYGLKEYDETSLSASSAFSWLRSSEGTLLLKDYYQKYLRAVRGHNTGFILESPTWRASKDWADSLGLSDNDLYLLNRKAINMLMNIRQAHECTSNQIPISGCIGPQNHDEQPSACLTHTEAKLYHMPQVKAFEACHVDFITAMTMTYTEEAIGIAQAALECHIPCVIAFTITESGLLPSGETLKEAIERVDHITHEAPLYYMVNCENPQHIHYAIESKSSWIERLQGIRGVPEALDTPPCSHHTHTNDPPSTNEARRQVNRRSRELALEYNILKAKLPSLNILGGCCGPNSQCITDILDTCGILWDNYQAQNQSVDMHWPFYGS